MYNKLNIRFYQNVAKLFYAIAAIDKYVNEKEFQKLQSIVKKEWLAVEDSEDEYKSDAAYQIEIVFEWLQSTGLDAQTCYKEFIEYKNAHPYFFKDDLNNLILTTAAEIADAFAGKNKSELIMLAKLHLDLQKTSS